MLRFIRRSVAPLLAGALAATVVVTVGDDVVPFDGLLTQAEATPPAETPPGEATTIEEFDLFDPEALRPIEQLDLDAVIDEDTGFDTDSVFADLSDVGDYFGIYRYGAEDRVDVAEELELVVPQERADEFDSDEVDVVPAREAAERFLLSEQCNALFALGIREQVTRPIKARILREDEELILQLGQLVSGDEIPSEFDVDPLAELPISRIFLDPFGRVLARAFDSTVKVGEVTVSVFDPDLVRARQPELLESLATEEALAGAVPSGDLDPDALVTPEALQAIWTSCVADSARERTQPVARTINGESVFTLTLDEPLGEVPDPAASGTEVVTWLERGLEVRITSSFDEVGDSIRVNPSVDLDTQEWLERFADPVEVAHEVARVIATRNADPTRLLVNEAFAAPSGIEYGEPLAGTEGRAKDALAAETAPPEAETPETPDGPSTKIKRVVARPVFGEGAVAANVTRLFLTPIEVQAVRPFIPADGVVQQAVWEPQFLNSDPFREGWRRGIADESDVFIGVEDIVDDLFEEDEFLEDPEVEKALAAAGVDLDELPDRQRREFVEELVEEVLQNEFGVLDLVFATREGVDRVHWLAPCYSMSVAGAVNFEAVMESQLEARRSVFGDRIDVFDDPDGPALGDLDLDYEVARVLFNLIEERIDIEDLDLDAAAGPALEEADSLDYQVAREKFLEEVQAEQDADDRAERAREDALRIAQCSSNNLEAHLNGFPVTDLDDNGVDDRIPENNV